MVNNIDELLENGFVERIVMKTPSGGDYSEAHFYDNNWNYTTKNLAVHVVIKEFTIDGNVINEFKMDKRINSV